MADGVLAPDVAVDEAPEALRVDAVDLLHDEVDLVRLGPLLLACPRLRRDALDGLARRHGLQDQSWKWTKFFLSASAGDREFLGTRFFI